MLNKFAEELKKKRQESGLTLKQLATKTRIDQKFLEAIEEGNFAFLPELYVKAFVKQFAKTIGLDENITLKKYEAAKEGKDYDLNPTASLEEKVISQEKEIINPEKTPDLSVPPNIEYPKQIVKSTSPIKSYIDETKTKNANDENKADKQLIIFGLGGVGLIIIAALIYFLFFNHSNKIIVEETPVDEILQESNERYVEEPSTEETIDDSTNFFTSSDSLYLTFFAKETSWVYVVIDNSRTQEFTLNPNSKFSVAAVREFKVTVGNSGGVTLKLNNQNVDFVGRIGSVRHFKIDKTGLVYLNTPAKIDQE